MSSESLPQNLISMNEAHCQLLAEQIKVLETRVIEMETSLLAQAARLHDSVIERLDSLFDDETIIEFDPFPENEGMIKISNPGKHRTATARSQEVFDTIKATRDQLERLNQTIENIQLAR